MTEKLKDSVCSITTKRRKTLKSRVDVTERQDGHIRSPEILCASFSIVMTKKHIFHLIMAKNPLNICSIGILEGCWQCEMYPPAMGWCVCREYDAVPSMCASKGVLFSLQFLAFFLVNTSYCIKMNDEKWKIPTKLCKEMDSEWWVSSIGHRDAVKHELRKPLPVKWWITLYVVVIYISNNL